MLTDFVLFRHAKAVRPHEADDDFNRGLTEVGEIQAQVQARRLKEAGFEPDVVLVSTALRAAQTWEVAAEFFPNARVRLTRNLYLATPTVYLESAEKAQAAQVLLIAHDPGLHDLARWFMKGQKGESPQGDELRAHLPTSGIAWFSHDDTAKNKYRLKQYFLPGSS